VPGAQGGNRAKETVAILLDLHRLILFFKHLFRYTVAAPYKVKRDKKYIYNSIEQVFVGFV
jgi:hypothetical protein